MPPKLGILAGSGDLPARVIQACRDSRRDFFVIAFEQQTDPAVVATTPHAWVRLGAAGTALAELRKAGVEELVMAGSIRRPSLAALRPDIWATKVLAKAGIRARGDDGLLSAIVRELEAGEGFHIVGPESILPGILAEEGVLGSIRPDEIALADVDLGIVVARAIGALDVGQGAVVQQGMVLAVEAAEGTDAMLARCRGLAREGPAGVLVKVRKPGQESRVDLPTIGVKTVKAAATAGLRGIAVEAGGALLVDRIGLIATADKAGVFVLGVALPPAG